MSEKKIMEFKITIDRSQISTMEKKGGKVTIIPFGGSVESDLFCGKVLPGAADIQATRTPQVFAVCAPGIYA